MGRIGGLGVVSEVRGALAGLAEGGVGARSVIDQNRVHVDAEVPFGGSQNVSEVVEQNDIFLRNGVHDLGEALLAETLAQKGLGALEVLFVATALLRVEQTGGRLGLGRVHLVELEGNGFVGLLDVGVGEGQPLRLLGAQPVLLGEVDADVALDLLVGQVDLLRVAVVGRRRNRGRLDLLDEGQNRVVGGLRVLGRVRDARDRLLRRAVWSAHLGSPGSASASA